MGIEDQPEQARSERELLRETSCFRTLLDDRSSGIEGADEGTETSAIDLYHFCVFPVFLYRHFQHLLTAQNNKAPFLYIQKRGGKE